VQTMTDDVEYIARVLIKLARGDIALVTQALDRSETMTLAVNYILTAADSRQHQPCNALQALQGHDRSLP